MTNSPNKAEKLKSDLAAIVHSAEQLDRTVRIMEVCGTHTVAIQRAGLRQILPDSIKLISGPGCPVCVTPTGYIDALVALAQKDKTIIATYGDMVRVTGSKNSLADARADGADLRVISSAFRAYTLARENPDHNVIFAAVGFETTAPASADILLRAKNAGVNNLFLLCAHKLVIPAMVAILEDDNCAIDAFLCPGHVSVIIGYKAYEPIVQRYHRPCVVAGFEPPQIVEAIARIISQLSANQAQVENAYTAAVGPDRHERAWQMLDRTFDTRTTEWRGLGEIPDSGLVINNQFEQFDAARRFAVSTGGSMQPPQCRCGQVIQGMIDPPQCALFGKRCTPEDPVGPCMVSSEGACQAWLKYGEFHRT